ncbi:MAG: type II toxin-antitoxin system VapC family toxin [Ardenticatenaceae bacterium]|nr:type II toxin-antitoxin system VapC family toxin [Ardenticatenaceae bacterium]
MNYLLDTNIISEFTKSQPDYAVQTWLETHQNEALYLSVITIGEIQQGIVRLPPSKRQQDLLEWLNQTILVLYAPFILPIDQECMLQWGTLTGNLIRKGQKIAVMDGLIAATALRHQLTLVTRNISDFVHTGLSLVNPWD